MSLESTRQRLSAAPRCPACHEDLLAGQPSSVCPQERPAKEANGQQLLVSLRAEEDA